MKLFRMSFLKSFLNRHFQDSNSIERWHRRGTITASLISLGTVLLFLILFLMKLGGVSLSHISYWHGPAVLVLLALSYGFWKRSRIASVGLLLLFLVEKSLLIFFGVLVPILALPILFVLVFLLSGGVLANFFYHRNRHQNQQNNLQSKSEIEAEIKSEQTTLRIPPKIRTKRSKERSKQLFQSYIFSFFILFLLCLASVLAKNFGLWTERFTENSVLGFVVSWSFILAVVAGLFRYVKREIGRLPMAVVNLLVLALVTSLTTVIPQHGTVPFQPLAYYSKAYGSILSEIIFFVDLHEIFHSWWFTTLVSSLVIGIVKVSFHRKFSLRNIPFHLTHFSIVWIILFAWYNYFFSFSGIIPLKEGQLSNRVQLFQNSAKKLKREYRELPFAVFLKQFQTRQWDASYKVFVQKFPKELPSRISESFYKNLKTTLPANFQASVEETYVPVTQLSTNPLVSILSALGLNYLASYEESGLGYILNSKTQKQNIEMTSKIFKVMGYKAKDLHSFPIQVGQTHKIWTSDISFRVLNYYKNHKQGYMLIPNEFSLQLLKKEILPRVQNEEDRQFLWNSYELKTNATVLEKDREKNVDFVVSSDKRKPGSDSKTQISRLKRKETIDRKRVAGIFSRIDAETILKSQIHLKNPALGIQIVREGKILVEDWLNVVQENPRNSLAFLEEGTKVDFLKESYSENSLKQVKKILKIGQNYVPHRLNVWRGDTMVQTISLEPEKIYPLKDSPYSIRLEEYYHDFAFQSNKQTDQPKDLAGKYFNASKQLKNPAGRFVLIENLSQNRENKNGKEEKETEKETGTHEFILFSLYKKLKTKAIYRAEEKTQYRFEYQYEPNLKTFVVSADPMRVFSLSSASSIQKSSNKKSAEILIEEPLVLGKPYILNPLITLYFTEFFSDWSQVQPIWVEAVDIPLEFPLEDFETKLVQRLSSEDADFIKTHYQIGRYAYHLRPQFRFDSERKRKIQEFLKRVSYSYPEENPLLELEIFRDNGFRKTLLLSAKGAFMRRFPISDSRYALSFESRSDQQTQYWKSHLQLLDLDNRPIPKASKVIQVNHYFYYGGYRLYQTDAKKEDPSYSGIGVTREPGLMFIYAGFVGLAIGVFMMFYLPKYNPKRKKIKKDQK